MANCSQLKYNCKDCGLHLKKGERQKVCPDCGADLRCRLSAVYGAVSCRIHGGGYPETRGTYPGRKLVTGGKSKFKLNRLVANYMGIVEDPELLSLRDPLAIITIRIEELIQKIDAEEAVVRQERVRKAFTDYRYFRKKRNEEKADEAFYKLDQAMEEMYDEYRAWEQMFKAVEVRRKLSESETKRLKEMNQFITQEEAYKFLAKVEAALIEVLGEHPRLLKRLQFKFIKLTGDGDDDVLGRSSRPEVVLGSSDMDAGEILDTRAEFSDGREGPDSTRIISGSVLEGGAE